MTISFKDLQLIYGVAGAREKFEQLCSLLIKSKYPDAKGVRVFKGDGGVDTSVGSWTTGSKVIVFQQKFFLDGLGKSQKDQIRESFAAASVNPNFSMKTWVLCLPIDLSTDEQKWFDVWAKKQSVRVKLWGELTLLGLLHLPENRDIRETYFRQEYLTQIRDIHKTIIEIAQSIASRPSGNKKESHDILMYRRITSDLLGPRFQDFLRHLGDNASFDNGSYDFVREYEYWTQDVNNEFVHPELREAQSAFNTKLVQLTTFIAFNFFTHRELDHNRKYLYPDLNPDYYGDNSPTSSRSKRFFKYLSEFEALVEGTLEEYAQFIRQAKAVLNRLGLL